MKKIRVISLGEIVTPDLVKGIKALAEMIKKKGSLPTIPMPEVMQAIVSQGNTIEQFKQGAISEDQFDTTFLNNLYAITKVMLTKDELNMAWAAMNPCYADFQHQLATASIFNSATLNEIIFVSYTNPKDIRHLTNELVSNNYPHKLDENGILSEIGGIKLHLSYVYKLTKAALLEKMIKDIHQSPRNSIFADANNSQERDIKYIYSSTRSIEALTFDVNANRLTLETADQYRIECLLWNKNTKPTLSEVLAQPNPRSVTLLAASL